jgi:hypothetical protein
MNGLTGHFTVEGKDKAERQQRGRRIGWIFSSGQSGPGPGEIPETALAGVFFLQAQRIDFLYLTLHKGCEFRL